MLPSCQTESKHLLICTWLDQRFASLAPRAMLLTVLSKLGEQMSEGKMNSVESYTILNDMKLYSLTYVTLP